MKDKTLECEFCGAKSTTEEGVKNHQKRTAKCLDIQLKKLGKHKYPPVVPRKPKAPSKKEDSNKKEASKKEPLTKEDTEDDDISENDEIPLESSEDEEQVEIKTSSEDDSDKEDAISFFKDMGASKFDNIKTFKKKYTTTSREVINDDEKPIVTPVTTTASIDMKEMMNTLVKVVDSVKKLEERVSQLISDNDKKNKELEKYIKSSNNTVVDKIEEMFGSTIENNIESSKKILAEIDSKNETLEIFKEDIEETCDKYYEIYKKFKSIKEDMEDMVRGSRRK